MSHPTTSPFSNRMGWGHHPALLIIDVCTAYFTAGSPLDTSSNPASAASPDSMRRLLFAARSSGCPIVFTKVEYDRYADMKDAGLFWSKTKALDVWRIGDRRGLDESVEGLEPIVVDVGGDEWVVKKKYPSAFFGTTLATDLYTRGVDTVVVCGVSTSGCVRASVLDAMCYGFRPMVVGSACGDRTKEVHEANMFDMGKSICQCAVVLPAMHYGLLPAKGVILARTVHQTSSDMVVDAKYADAVSEKEAVEKLEAGWK